MHLVTISCCRLQPGGWPARSKTLQHVMSLWYVTLTLHMSPCYHSHQLLCTVIVYTQ